MHPSKPIASLSLLLLFSALPVACDSLSALQLDIDVDGIPDVDDNCPGAVNPGQQDTDGDGEGDICDPCPEDPINDPDGDTFCSGSDNCPEVSNRSQSDADSDGWGDACDPCPDDPDNDVDGDGWCGDEDNCPDHANPDQTDSDGNGFGDVCDYVGFLVINELFYDADGVDGPHVFTELWGPPSMALDGHWLVGVNGFSGQDYAPVDLSGAVIPADGLLVVATSSATGEVLAARDLVGNVDWQNGPDSVQLRGPGGVVVDAVAYGNFDAINPYSAGEGDPAPDVPFDSSLSRDLNHFDRDDNAMDFVQSVPSPGVP
jgi:hypothetical protein